MGYGVHRFNVSFYVKACKAPDEALPLRGIAPVVMRAVIELALKAIGELYRKHALDLPATEGSGHPCAVPSVVRIRRAYAQVLYTVSASLPSALSELPAVHAVLPPPVAVIAGQNLPVN
jgi:hypothetical protein